MANVFSSVDAAYVESLERQYRADPSSVEWSWQILFRALDEVGARSPQDSSTANLIRERGHLIARASNPLNFESDAHAEEQLVSFRGRAPLVEHPLERIYTGTLSVESAHIDDYELRDWIGRSCESGHPGFDPQERRRALELLVRAEEFERFLSVKHPTKKRFGAEGVEAVLPLLDRILYQATASGVTDVIVGSMHRGRLNMMANVLGLPLPLMFALLQGSHPFPGAARSRAADVPYHLGVTAELSFGEARIRVTLAPNPSHLEAINSTILGRVRARQDTSADRSKVLGIILHTDASVVAQGVVAENLQLSGIPGFATEGTIHIIINNQIGFTTDPSEARTSRHCTGPWKAIDALIVHVSADDVDRVLEAADTASAWRREWKRDAVIDLVGYRRNGHNELDEPRFTQPKLYAHIDDHPPVTSIYAQQLVAEGAVDQGGVANLRKAIWASLQEAYEAADQHKPETVEIERKETPARQSRRVDLGRITWLIEQISQVPGNIVANPKVDRIVRQRLEAVRSGVNWALAEALALGSLLLEGINVRLTGQDVVRGTFSHRHFEIHDGNSGARRMTLAHLPGSRGRLHLHNSPLSEYAVLGFEYGYSVESRGTLVIWEAQFGDFANGAQIILDQFVASGEDKWGVRSGLVVLLPHGLEGQGPEHSSARPERLVQLAASDNLRLVHPSTPANYFHLLRDQALSDEPVPLIILSPKTLLRLPAASSPVGELAGEVRFQPIIVSPAVTPRTYLICSGKIAYELEAELAEREVSDIAVIRLEQIYPFPAAQLKLAFGSRSDARLAWVQEEPENGGLWNYLERRLNSVLRDCGVGQPAMAFTRRESPSPAGSFHTDHSDDQMALIQRAVDWAKMRPRHAREHLHR